MDSNVGKNLSVVKKALLELRRTRAELIELRRSLTEPIAIIGMACRFPGGATDPEAFWRNLSLGIDSVREQPPDRWDLEAHYDPDPDAPGKICTRHGCFLDSVDTFDARFFGITPQAARAIDPQQRLLLEASWEALEDGGQAPGDLAGSNVGVFVGLSAVDYKHLVAESGPDGINVHTLTGVSPAVAAGRISNYLGLRGPSVTTDGTCCSSLLALQMACQSLRLGESRMALAGGASLMLQPFSAIGLSQLGILSPDGRSKAFDASGDGYGRGEGCGVVVLKRLSDALNDRDRVLALVRGMSASHSGRSASLIAPSGSAQAEVIREALKNAGVDPSQVSYVEAHGTGTPLGDAMELEALAEVYCKDRPAERALAVGSVKSSIGHLEAASGIAGLIKVVLALQHKQLPPSPYPREINPAIDLSRLSVVLPTAKTHWASGGQQRIAGLTTYAINGTNVHVLLEEAPPADLSDADAEPDAELERPQHLLALSAKSPEALGALRARYERQLEAGPTRQLQDICFSANTGRSHFEHRLTVVAGTTEELQRKLSTLSAGGTPPGVTAGQVETKRRPKVGLVFPGLDSVYPGMGRQLYETQPTFREALELCAKLAEPYLEAPLLEVLYGGQTARLDRPLDAWLALFALECALTELLRAWGIRPSVVMGDGASEHVAMWAAGGCSLEDGLRSIAELFQQAGDTQGQGSRPELDPTKFSKPRIKLILGRSTENLIDSGCKVFVEAGPTLEASALGERCSAVEGVVWSPMLRRGEDDWQQVLESLSRLYVAGVPVDWGGFDRDYNRKRVSLPTYPFERERFWPERQRSRPQPVSQVPALAPRRAPARLTGAGPGPETGAEGRRRHRARADRPLR